VGEVCACGNRLTLKIVRDLPVRVEDPSADARVAEPSLLPLGAQYCRRHAKQRRRLFLVEQRRQQARFVAHGGATVGKSIDWVGLLV